MSFSAYCPVEGGQLYYETTGEGQGLILIHAGIAHSQMWDEQVKLFLKHYQVIRYDLRGHGKTQTEAVKFSNAKDLNALLEHLNLSKVHLCGISMGGKVALEFALSYPDKVSSLIMSATGLMNSPQQSNQEVQLFKEMEGLEEAADWRSVAAIDVRLFVDGPNSPEGRADADVRQKVHDMALSNYLAFEQAFPTGEAEPNVEAMLPPAFKRLNELKVPTLTLVGDLDISRAQFTSDLLAREIQHAKQIIIKDTAHLANMEKPDWLNQSVLEFLAEVSS